MDRFDDANSEYWTRRRKLQLAFSCLVVAGIALLGIATIINNHSYPPNHGWHYEGSLSNASLPGHLNLDTPLHGLACLRIKKCFAINDHTGIYSIDPIKRVFSLHESQVTYNSISCIPGKFCYVLVEYYRAADYFRNGALFSRDGIKWTFSPIPQARTSYDKAQLSCLAIGRCIYVYQPGMWWTLTGSIWKFGGDNLIGTGPLSCPTSTWCFDFGSLDSFVYSYPNLILTRHSLGLQAKSASLSCLDTHVCFSLEQDGSVVEFRNNSYVRIFQRRALFGASHIVSEFDPHWIGISCTKGPHCIMADNHGRVISYASGRWSSLISLGQAPTKAFTCLSTRYCVAIFADDAVWIRDQTK